MLKARKPPMQRQQSFFGRMVRVVHEERPFKAPHEVEQLLTMLAQAFLIPRPQGLGASGNHPFAGLGGGKLRVALVGECFLGRIEHLDKMTSHALHGELLQARREFLDWFKKI